MIVASLNRPKSLSSLSWRVCARARAVSAQRASDGAYDREAPTHSARDARKRREQLGHHISGDSDDESSSIGAKAAGARSRRDARLLGVARARRSCALRVASGGLFIVLLTRTVAKDVASTRPRAHARVESSRHLPKMIEITTISVVAERADCKRASPTRKKKRRRSPTKKSYERQRHATERAAALQARARARSAARSRLSIDVQRRDGAQRETKRARSNKGDLRRAKRAHTRARGLASNDDGQIGSTIGDALRSRRSECFWPSILQCATSRASGGA